MQEIDLNNANELLKVNFYDEIRIIPTYLLTLLKETELPIKQEKAIMAICDFLSFVHYKLYSLENKKDENLLTIHNHEFRQFFSGNYKKYKDLLSKFNVITNVPYENGEFYQPDAYAMQYRIHNQYLSSKEFTVLFFTLKTKKEPELQIETKDISKVFVKTIIDEELDYYKVFTNEIHYYNDNKDVFKRQLNKELFKPNALMKATPISLYKRLSVALGFKNRKFIKSGTKVDRIYHNLSCMSKVSRACTETEYYNIDFKNSQPTLLCIYLSNNKINYEMNYKKVCEEGKFYELFIGLLDTIKTGDKVKDTKVERDEIKVECYKSIFFNFKTGSVVNKKFKELFPILWQALKDIDETTNLAGILQNLEASIFNKLKINKSKKYYTVYDAIYFSDERDIEFIKNQILEYSDKTGVKISLSIEKNNIKI